MALHPACMQALHRSGRAAAPSILLTLALVSTAPLRTAARWPRLICCLAAAVNAALPAKLLVRAEATTFREALPTEGRTKACRRAKSDDQA